MKHILKILGVTIASFESVASEYDFVSLGGQYELAYTEEGDGEYYEEEDRRFGFQGSS